MDTRELRIGNWAYNTYQKKYFRFDDGSEIDIVAKFCEPIQLTTEILEKAGFKDEDGPLVKYPLYVYDEGNTGVLRVMIGKPWSDGMANKAQYLHQLQNLYFSLTGTELDVKL